MFLCACVFAFAFACAHGRTKCIYICAPVRLFFIYIYIYIYIYLCVCLCLCVCVCVCLHMPSTLIQKACFQVEHLWQWAHAHRPRGAGAAVGRRPHWAGRPRLPAGGLVSQIMCTFIFKWMLQLLAGNNRIYFKSCHNIPRGPCGFDYNDTRWRVCVCLWK